MKLKLTFGIAILAVGLILLIAFLGKMRPDPIQTLVGQPAPEPVLLFLSPENKKGNMIVILTDNHEKESQERSSELFNLVVKLGKEGTSIRELSAWGSGFAYRSYEQTLIETRGAPNDMIPAAKSVLYSDSAIRQLPKPCALFLTDSQVTEVKTGESFNAWVEENKPKKTEN